MESKDNTTDRLWNWDQVPAWQQDNRYIITGYRGATYSYRKALTSLGYLHNQTGNIFTHLLAIPALVILAVLVYHVRHISTDPVDRLIIAIFVVGVSTCFLLSTCFHTFSCHSAPVEQLWVRVDFLGIIIITAATFVAGEYYFFFCEHIRMGIHMAVTISLSVLAITVLLTPRLQGPKHRTLRLVCFCLMGVSGFVPMIDSLAHYGWDHSKRYSIVYYLIEMLLEVVGAVLYGCRLPERFAPGRFDMWGHSHQFFHIFTAAAACVHLTGLANAARKTRALERCASGY
ncbi:hemolysin-III related-domain-containing protein [Elsinoe ampelina]|uniref:Hemolysin-III related-domain-containing protein n=1 Tax=Elsinoe ampelina TaxID=302913 RepID=A0A6A6FZK8_9PEZI|nr:hemolysin-III related-domain-containing protein [Elsinoe ampelina]